MRNLHVSFVLAAFAVAWSVAPATAQFGNPAPQQQNVQQPMVGGVGFGTMGANQGSGGGAASADFDSLIDLIQSTVAVDTWAETGGGEAEIRPFPTGVMVDAALTSQAVERGGGLLRRFSDLLVTRPRRLLLILLAPPLLWLGVVYLGSLFALLLQSFF